MEDLFNAIQIQTITGCTRTCDFCANAYVENTPQGDMSDHIFELIIRQLKELHFSGRVSPYLMNEPLLDIARLRSLFEAGLDGLIVDCYDTQEQFMQMMEMCRKGLEGIADIEMQPNFDIRKLPLKVKFVQVYDCSDYRVESPFLTNVGGHVKRDIGIKLPLDRSCFAVFEQMYVNYKGDAVLCCQDWGFKVVLGTVAKDGLLGIWYGEALKHYRERLLQGDRGSLALCRICDSRSEKDFMYVGKTE